MIFGLYNKKILYIVICTIGLNATAGDLICKGKSKDQRPVLAVVRAEMKESTAAHLGNLDTKISKNGMIIHSFLANNTNMSPFNLGSRRSVITDISGNSDRYNVSLLLPSTGRGFGRIQVKEWGTEDILAQVPMQCKYTAGLSVREKNELCIASAKKYATQKLKSISKEAVLTSAEVEVEDETQYNGVYILEFYSHEECLNNITIKTRLIESPNKKTTCEAVSYELGDEQCG